MIDSLRGTGRTTKQMIKADYRAVFVWPNGHLSYPKILAIRLERTDLRIVSPAWLTMPNVFGTDAQIILDHATPQHLDQRQRDVWEAAFERNRLRPAKPVTPGEFTMTIQGKNPKLVIDGVPISSYESLVREKYQDAASHLYKAVKLFGVSLKDAERSFVEAGDILRQLSNCEKYWMMEKSYIADHQHLPGRKGNARQRKKARAKVVAWWLSNYEVQPWR